MIPGLKYQINKFLQKKNHLPKKKKKIIPQRGGWWEESEESSFNNNKKKSKTGWNLETGKCKLQTASGDLGLKPRNQLLPHSS